MKTPGLKLIIATILSVVAAACSSVGTALRTSVDWSDVPLQVRYDSLRAAAPGWRTISFSGKVRMTAPEKHSCTASFFMKRDSLIHVSLRAYGVEGAVIRVTPDSVFIYNKVDKIVTGTSTDRFFGDTGIALSDLQDILLGQLPAGIISGHDASMTSRRGNWSIASVAGTGGAALASVVTVETRTNLISSADFSTNTASTRLRFDKWGDVAGSIVPTQSEVTYSHHKLDNRYSLSLKLTAKSLKINQGRTPAWRVSRDAVRADYDLIHNQLISTMQ